MINFLRGLESKYNYPENSKFKDALYFATDTGALFMNGVRYGMDGERIKNVEFNDSTNTFTFTKQDDTTVTVSLGDKLLTDADRDLLEQVKDIIDTGNISVKYDSQLDESITTVSALGGIAAGTSVKSLKSKTLSQVFDDLLFPTVNPTLTNPSASLALKGYSNIQLVGSPAPVADTNFTKTFNRGSIKIGNNEQNKRAGEQTSEVIYYNTEATTYPNTIVEGTMNFYYRVNYAEGPQPKNSKGENYSTPLAAGSVTSAACPVYGVYRYYAGIGNLTKEIPLTNNKTFDVTLGAENGTNKHQFAIPAKYTLTKVEVLNTLNNKWEAYDHTSGLTSSTEDISGVSYKKYVRNDTGLNGELQYRITFNK